LTKLFLDLSEILKNLGVVVPQVVECLPRKHGALSPNTSTARKDKKGFYKPVLSFIFR
jgi:hypothetical protein